MSGEELEKALATDMTKQAPLEKLLWHPLVETMPRWADDSAELRALAQDIGDRGIDQPIIVCSTVNGQEDGFLYVIDGRHRHMGAKRAKLAEVPVIVVPEADAPEIITQSIVQRRHYTKGALAYMLAPMLEATHQAAAQRRFKNLIPDAANRGKSFVSASETRKPTQSGYGKFEDFVRSLGFSDDLLRQARAVRTHFAKSDDRLLDWKVKNPELCELLDRMDRWAEVAWAPERWLQFCDENGEVGSAPPPENLRQRFEPLILNGDMGLGATLQAIAGLDSTKGINRKDNPPVELLGRAFRDLRTRFSYWEKLGAEDRAQVASHTRALVEAMPGDLIAEIRSAMKERERQEKEAA